MVRDLGPALMISFSIVLGGAGLILMFGGNSAANNRSLTLLDWGHSIRISLNWVFSRLIEIHQSDKDLASVTLESFIAAAVRQELGWMQASGGLFHTPRVKNNHWLSVAQIVIELEQRLNIELTDAHSVLDQIRNDPWTQITVRWSDVER